LLFLIGISKQHGMEIEHLMKSLLDQHVNGLTELFLAQGGIGIDLDNPSICSRSAGFKFNKSISILTGFLN